MWCIDVNGTYTKVVGQTFDGAPVYGKGDCVIYRDSRSMGWYIQSNFGGIGNLSPYYGSPNNADSMTPPTNGWVVLYGGARPAPKLRIATTNNDVDSEGAQKVGGSNGSSNTAGPSSAAQSSRDAISKDGSRARSIPDHIVVSECGNVELNGRYTTLKVLVCFVNTMVHQCIPRKENGMGRKLHLQSSGG